MKMNFGISIRRGIYIPLALLACCAPATYAVAIQTDTKPVESEQADPEEGAEPKTSDEATEQTEPVEMTKSVKDQILQLTTEFDTKYSELVAAFKAAKDDGERRKLQQSSPRAAYAAKFLELYEANADDEDALPALHQALIVGGRRAAAKPIKMLLELIDGQDSKTAQSSCAVLIRHADTRTKAIVAQKLVKFGQEAADNAEASRKEAIKLLLPVATTPLRGVGTIQKDAIESISELAKINPESTDVVALGIVAFNSDQEASTAAFNAIKEYHLDNKDLLTILASVPRRVIPGYEALLQEVVETGKGDLQTQAVISLVKYTSFRDRNLDRSKLSEEELAATEKERKKILELLKSYDGDSDLHKKAQDELFVLEKLSPGAEAMDIVGTDLDGKELKLSDYRGQVVFLDFWGDW